MVVNTMPLVSSRSPQALSSFSYSRLASKADKVAWDSWQVMLAGNMCEAFLLIVVTPVLALFATTFSLLFNTNRNDVCC
jgi:hypothetical protein